MFDRFTAIRVLGRTASVAALVIAFAAPALAGSCPAGQMKTDARQPVTFAAKGVTIDRRKIALPESIKAVGTFELKVTLVSDVVATLKVEVVAK